MPTATEEHYAKEAARLLSDETLASAFETVKLNAMLRLTEIDPSTEENIAEIRRQQAIANCLQEVRDALHAAILATGKSDGGMSLTPPGNS